jgi:hypothetical protein
VPEIISMRTPSGYSLYVTIGNGRSIFTAKDMRFQVQKPKKMYKAVCELFEGPLKRQNWRLEICTFVDPTEICYDKYFKYYQLWLLEAPNGVYILSCLQV